MMTKQFYSEPSIGKWHIFQLHQHFTQHYINVTTLLLKQSAHSGIISVHMVNLAFSKFCESEKGELNIECLTSLSQNNTCRLTSGPSGYCPLTGTDPERPRVGVQAPICCKATQWTGRTAGCGTGWRSRLHLPPWRSCLFERCRQHSGFLFAAKGLGRHQGRTGLKQEEERGERGDSWGPLGTTGSPLGFMKPRTGGRKGENHIWSKHERPWEDAHPHKYMKTKPQHQHQRVKKKHKTKKKQKKEDGYKK